MQPGHADGRGGAVEGGATEDRGTQRAPPPRTPAKTRSSGALPLTCAASSSTRKPGSGTSRRSCPFGVPQTCCEPTRVTDSAITARRRRKSIPPTRSAAISPNRTVRARNSTMSRTGRCSAPRTTGACSQRRRGRRAGHRVQLFVGEVPLLDRPHPREIHAGRGVAHQPAVLDGEREDQRQHAVQLANSRRLKLLAELGDPCLDSAVVDVVEVAHRHLRPSWVDVDADLFRGLDAGQVALRVDLAVERLGPLVASRVAVAGVPAHLPVARLLLDARDVVRSFVAALIFYRRTDTRRRLRAASAAGVPRRC